ncbi:MAG: hypothetical protein IAF38_18260 [Bacteroidia bacterium]|nr:hypothetical protein [Bacteroidia bacterium]
MRKGLNIILLLLISCSIFVAQRKKPKFEYIAGIGTTSFLGDLGGANAVGTHFIKDLDFASTRPLLVAGVRIKRHPIFGFKSMLSIGMLRGDDKWTKDPFRNNRNLNFRAPIVELSAQAEFYFVRERIPKLYSFKSVGKKKKNIAAYAFLGVGGLLFVPQGNYNGKWYSLRKMSTEGQGLANGAKAYSPVTIVIPYGLGFKYGLTRKFSVGAELGLRFSFSDYIDDVSGTYYDKNALAAAKGQTAAALADPSLGDIYGATSPATDGTPAQRGDVKNKDSYAFIQFSVDYKVYKSKKRRTRSKF